MATIAPSFDDLVTAGIAEAQAARPDLAFNDGDVSEAMVHGSAAMNEAVLRHGIDLFRSLWYSSSKGDRLSALVVEKTNGKVQRKEATKAQTSGTLTRIATITGGTVPAGTQIGTGFDDAGSQTVFVTDTAVTFAIAESSKPVNITAADAGSSGNVVAGSITHVIDALFDTFTFSNPAAAGGGNEKESDEDFIIRGRAYWDSLRGGTLKGLEYGALLVPSVRSAIAVEDSGSGLVVVRVTDSDGNSTIQMINNVAAELENWRAGGVHVSVDGGSKVLVNLTIKLVAMAANFDPGPYLSQMQDVAAARITRLRAGEKLYLDTIDAAVIGVVPDQVFRVDITAMSIDATNVAIADYQPGQIELLRPGTITVAT